MTAICGGRGHSFDECPQLSSHVLKAAYICLCLLVNRFKKGFSKLDPGGEKHDNDLNTISHFFHQQLDAIETMDVSRLMSSFSSPSL